MEEKFYRNYRPISDGALSERPSFWNHRELRASLGASNFEAVSRTLSSREYPVSSISGLVNYHLMHSRYLRTNGILFALKFVFPRLDLLA